ncbi:hypothetical protein Sa4125_06460 [Aureimonas sp. SA4125]|uniref:protein-disulfide reductase DsbD domain-containing protein n=1 Tax=Aureimonas sp. SA4125 TaxID=2826993 RepID=UPI001CC79453|nr:protein-disulfide reductase DsbD domain-containing protein [Aureimonas sp. SA4125]BDA83104.1 hypothetical protein Sa4125_06460 [Aureimonas sp. SA4125]
MFAAFRLKHLPLAFAALAGLAAHASAQESVSDRFASEAVVLTLVAEEPDAAGAVRAALRIDLAPGWKTYWLDPGDAGIAPMVDVSQSQNAVADTLSFPAPRRFGDESGSSNGYVQPMAIAIRMHAPLAREETVVRAKVFIGVCRDICIPVAADLATVPRSDAGSVVAAAFDALPAAGDGQSGITDAALSADGATLSVTANWRGTDTPDLFVAGPQGWSFGTPTSAERVGNRIAFTLPVRSKPRRAATTPPTLDMVMTAGASAVEARAVIPGRLP